MPNQAPHYTFELTMDATGTSTIAPMDPRLQRLVAFRQRGIRKPTTSLTVDDEVAVVAKVTDLSAWEALSEVRVGVTLGDTAADGSTIVTARIPVGRIEQVRVHPFVASLKAAKRLKPTLNATIAEILAALGAQPANVKGKGGTGVTVGIVDFGCDFAHRNFTTSRGTTRIRTLWDQNSTGVGKAGFDYGTVYTKRQIDAALKRALPYDALGYGPDPAEPAHGTHVMDIAAGNGRGSRVVGVAPNAEVIFVEPACSDIPWNSAEVVGKNFGDSVQLLEALAFIFAEAGSRPCVVNVSLGTNGGPHDGTSLFEQGVDRLLQQAPNRAVVIAASNSFADGIHATDTVPQGGQLDLTWIASLHDTTENELELWYPGNTRLDVEIITPDGASLGRVASNSSGTVSQDGNNPLLFVSNRLDDPNNHDNMVGVFLAAAAPRGNWTIRLHGDANQPVTFHAWIERDDRGQSQFAPPHNNSWTLGSISCAHLPIAVGSYDAHKPSLPLSFFSSAGPTRDGREKPEVSAPGHDVRAALSRSSTGVTRMSGTSMAAPVVTGAIALMLAEAKARHLTLTTDQIRQAVIATARRNPPPAGAWDPRYGFGRISAKDLVETVLAMSNTP